MRQSVRRATAYIIVSLATLISCYTVLANWQFSVGPVYRSCIDYAIRGSSYVQSLGIHAIMPYGLDPAGIGRGRGVSDRYYDDGYVKTDVASADDGLTWNWGWEDGDQFDGGSQTLSFQRGGGRRVYVDTLLDNATRKNGDLDAAGVAFMAARTIRCPFLEDRGSALKVCFGAQALWNETAQFKGTTYREQITQEKYTVVDTYDVGYDLTASLANPPPYDGSFLGPGPLIEGEPLDRERVVTSRKVSQAENYVEIDIESDLCEFWLGPGLTVRPADNTEIYFISSISLTRVTMDIDRSERFTVTHAGGSSDVLNSWHNSTCESEWSFGAGIQVGATVDLTDDWFAGAFGTYDWVDEANVDIGPNSISVDPTGYTVGFEIGTRL